MRTLTTLLCFLLVYVLSFGQKADLYPKILSFPDISDKGLADFEKEKMRFEELIKEDVPYDSRTSEEQGIIDKELYFSMGPFSTEAPGCSWYCATGPKELKASSTLAASKVSSYEANNLHDFKLKTAWVDGKEGYGVGEEIEIKFELGEGQLKLTHIDIFNGYCKSEATWKANSRVKTFAISINGKEEGKLHLWDTYLGQRFELGSLGGNITLKLKILEVYPGTKYKDTAISEINFDGTGDH